MRFRPRATASFFWAIAFGVCVIGPAWADQLDDMFPSPKALGISSFVVESTGLGIKMRSIVTFDPDLSHSIISNGKKTTEEYVRDHRVYMRSDPGWISLARDMTNPDWQNLRTFILIATLASALPPSATSLDVVEGGVTYGTIQAPSGKAGGKMICTYDRATKWMHSCKGGGFTETFSAYNDPANTIVVPPAVLAARRM
jgi:hypothetical protein